MAKKALSTRACADLLNCELMDDGAGSYSVFKAIVAIVLFMGICFGLVALRQTLEKMRTQEQAVATASGTLADLILAQFTEWRLTPAVRDVGFLALKGLDVAEIAVLRKAAAGTVRA